MGTENAFTPRVVENVDEQANVVISQQTSTSPTISKITGIPAQHVDPNLPGYTDSRLMVSRAKLASLPAIDSNLATFLKDTTLQGIKPVLNKIVKPIDDITKPINKFNIPSIVSGVGNKKSTNTTHIEKVSGKRQDNTVPNDESQGKFGYKVRLFAARRFPTERVIFEVSPTFSESRQVDYTGVSPVHMPGSIQIYKKTNSRTFSIGAKFISRNTSQATENMKYLQQLRGWTMPYFGLRSNFDETTTANSLTDPNRTALNDGAAMLGAPPDVLYLYAYSSSQGASDDRDNANATNIKKLPVVITSLSMDYSPDVDYIITESGEPFPVKMDVKIDLTETHSPKGYEEFSLHMFKNGQLVQF